MPASRLVASQSAITLGARVAPPSRSKLGISVTLVMLAASAPALTLMLPARVAVGAASASSQETLNRSSVVAPICSAADGVSGVVVAAHAGTPLAAVTLTGVLMATDTAGGGAGDAAG